MNEKSLNKYRVGHWEVDFQTGICHLIGDATEESKVRLEPKSCLVLQALVESAGTLIEKEKLIQRVWPDGYASDDTLLRTVSRLRKSLEDDPKAPKFIETIPKRGYRLIAQVEKIASAEKTPGQATEELKRQVKPYLTWTALAVILVLSILFGVKHLEDSKQSKDLLTQADDYYHQMRLADNEMAISLYEQHIEMHPNSSSAYAGLANAFVQKAIRWSLPAEQGEQSSLTERVVSGALENEASQNHLRRAHTLAQRAMALQPENVAALKAMGFVLSAQGQFEQAIETYRQALSLDDQAWQVWINLGELYSATGKPELAIESFEAAFDAMNARYQEQEVQIRPWIADMAAMIGDNYLMQESYANAENWYRESIRHAPLHESGTLGLAQVLYLTGDRLGGAELCQQLASRLQKEIRCEQLPETPAILN